MDAWYRFSSALARVLLRALRVDLRWHGEEHLPTSGSALLASVHVGYADFVFIARAAGSRSRAVRFLCRHDVWHIPVVRRAMTAMRHVPVDRRVPAAAYLQARALLRSGEVVCVFPEAGISYSYTVRSLMPGAVALARETGLPIIPVAIWGSQRLYSVGRPVRGREPRPDLTRGRVVDVRFGAPMVVAADADLTQATVALGHALTEMLEALQRLPEHQPTPGVPAPWHPAHLGGHAPDRREALDYDVLPRSAVPACWGPPTPDPARELAVEECQEAAGTEPGP